MRTWEETAKSQCGQELEPLASRLGLGDKEDPGNVMGCNDLQEKGPWVKIFT